MLGGGDQIRTRRLRGCLLELVLLQIFLDMFALCHACVAEPLHKVRLQHYARKKCPRVNSGSWLSVLYIYLVSGLAVGQEQQVDC